jgi:uncharacterized protein YcfL
MGMKKLIFLIMLSLFLTGCTQSESNKITQYIQVVHEAAGELMGNAMFELVSYNLFDDVMFRATFKTTHNVSATLEIYLFFDSQGNITVSYNHF